MSTQVSLRCRCGEVHGVANVSIESGTRVVCYCRDCQAFARFLERPDVLDAAGGTDLFQMAAAQLRIAEGASAVRCMRLSQSGLLRWYTECCRTPVGNTLSARVPFVGVIQPFMDHIADGRSRDEVLGKPFAFVHGRYAIGGLPANAHSTAPFGLITRSVRLMGRWWLADKAAPSLFVDPRTRRAGAEPRVLSIAERAAL